MTRLLTTSDGCAMMQLEHLFYCLVQPAERWGKTMLNPCRFRDVTEHGELVCSKITGSSRDVSLQICQTCPVGAIGCQHLRVSLRKQEGGSILVRFGNGRTEVWEGEPAGARLQRAACAELRVPVSGPQMCAVCGLRSPVSTQEQGIAQRVAQVAEAGAGNIVAMPASAATSATC